MNNYINSSIPGELWIRDFEGKKEIGSNALSSVYLKYSSKYPTFFSELTSNQITRFDCFLDCVFVETKSGAILEKLSIDGDKFKPFNMANLHVPKVNLKKGLLNFNTYVDYWYDENSNKIYYVYLVALEENKTFRFQYSLAIIMDEFDCHTGLTETVLFDKLTLAFKDSKNWDLYDYVLENPKITYNKDTLKFNFSFLLKNKSRDFGLISINYLKNDTLERGHYAATEVNGHLPYFDLDFDNCFIGPYDPSIIQRYRILTVATFNDDPAYKDKFIVLRVQNQDLEFVDKYLVTE